MLVVKGMSSHSYHCSAERMISSRCYSISSQIVGPSGLDIPRIEDRGSRSRVPGSRSGVEIPQIRVSRSRSRI